MLVTGASSGVGRALARSAAETLVLPVDLSRPEEVERMVRQTLERFGRIDVLLANAGSTSRGRSRKAIRIAGTRCSPST